MLEVLDPVVPVLVPTLGDECPESAHDTADIVLTECVIVDEDDTGVMLSKFRPVFRKRPERLCIVRYEDTVLLSSDGQDGFICCGSNVAVVPRCSSDDIDADRL